MIKNNHMNKRISWLKNW